MSAAFDTIAIVGAGLIGGSISHAARTKGAARRVVLWDHDADALKRAGEIGLGDVATSLAAAVGEADAVFLCIPVGVIAPVAGACAMAMKSGAVLTDVGSVKGNVAQAFRAVGRGDVHMIPGHPIAGTERSDYAAAVDRLATFWTQLGSKVECMDATRHDTVLAVTSHIPHLIAYNIVATAHDMESVTEGEVVKFSAAGFRDFTRIAASDPTMWRDVFLHNREAVLDVLGRFDDDLTALRKAIRRGDGETLFNLFTHARGIRREIIEAGQDTAATNFGRDGSKKS
jgi:cyclohexadieny/prephenate dehydrogenase